MRARSLVAAAATVIVMMLGLRIASADPKSDIQSKIKQAMEAYDSMDYDGARKLLNQALAVAKKAKLDKDPLAAKAYLDLGIVAFAVPDQDAAKLSFLSAVQIDPKIQIDAAYKSADVVKLLDQARSEAGGGGAGEPASTGAGASVDCSSVKGLQHAVIDTAKAGAPQPIEALVAADVKSTKIVLMYRPEGATDFTEVKLTKEGGCKYTGQIPASAMKGSLVHYYVAALNDNGKPIAAKGSSGSPNIVEITGGVAGGSKGGDDEDPIGGKAKPATGGGGGGGGGSVSSGITIAPTQPKVMVALSGGTGSGYVVGTTEGGNMVKNCCLGGAIVVLIPEVAYMVSPQISVGVAGRIGLPLGANVDNHATAAPGGVVRVRYALAPSGEGLRFMGQIGAGILRNTIKLDNSMPGMDVDVVAQGPLLIGGGIGFNHRLSNNLAFIADLSAIAGLAVVDHLSSAPYLNSGLSADLSLGLAVGF